MHHDMEMAPHSSFKRATITNEYQKNVPTAPLCEKRILKYGHDLLFRTVSKTHFFHRKTTNI